MSVAAISIGRVSISRGTKFGVRNSSGKKIRPAELVAAALRVLSATSCMKPTNTTAHERGQADQQHEAEHAAGDRDPEDQPEDHHQRRRSAAPWRTRRRAARARSPSATPASRAACRSSRPRSPRRGTARPCRTSPPAAASSAAGRRRSPARRGTRSRADGKIFAAWPTLTTRKNSGMNSVGSSASGVRQPSRSARCPSTQDSLMPTPPARRRRRGCASGRSRRGTRRRASDRGRGRSRSRSSAFRLAGVPSRTIRPPSMIASRSHSASASSRYCVVRNTVVPLLVDPPHLLPDREPARRVEPGRRLVEEQHLGPVHERGREVQPALHAARVGLDAAVRRVLELDEREQLARALGRLGGREPEQAGLQDQQLAPVLARVEPGLLQRDADPLAHRVGVAGDVDARDRRAART